MISMSDIERNILKSNKGMALLLAVTVMSLLVAVTVEFNKNMRQELVGSFTVKDNSQLGAILKSGYNLAEAVLFQDKQDNKYDSGYDRWAQLESSNLATLFGRGNLELIIRDLTGKLQLNSLGAASSAGDNGREILTKLLLNGEFGDLSADDVSLIVDAITDWVDADDDPKGFEETESSFYQSLDPAYTSKNGPFEFIEELLLVRGITRDLYFGTGEYKGLRDYVTVYGDDGKININNAPVEILQAMDENMAEDLVQEMVVFREDEGNKELLENATWYSQHVSGDLNFDADMVTTESNYFDITAVARHVEMERILYAVVKRDSDGTISLISRKVE